MIDSLRLQHFRSYADASFNLGSGVNIIVGPNGSGKTNLLEAVLVLSRGGSYRAADGELVGFGAEWGRLDAKTTVGARIVKIQATGPEKWAKSFELDGHKLLRMTSSRSLPVVLFEPNHLLMLSGSPELRRSFLDDLIEQTSLRFGPTRRHYKRVLAQRNALLKRQPRDLKEQLFVWNVRLSELGGQIARERMGLIEIFNQHISDTYQQLSDKDHKVALQYISKVSTADYETALLRQLENSLELDILRGFTANGPHRDDLRILLNDHPAPMSASRGESRTLVLALKLLELHLVEEARQQKPILLLDDVFSELDKTRRLALTKKVSSHQTFITTTDAEAVSRHFKDGNIIKL
jgi:DNA replication and repair protein RecF